MTTAMFNRKCATEGCHHIVLGYDQPICLACENRESQALTEFQRRYDNAFFLGIGLGVALTIGALIIWAVFF